MAKNDAGDFNSTENFLNSPLQSIASGQTPSGEYVEIIERGGRAQTKIIDDILDLSKVEAGRLQVETMSVDLKLLINEVVSLHPTRVRICIKDSGLGIPKDKHKQLFQAFNQLNNSRTRQFGGTGLGLVLSKKLAQAMDGDVFLESSELGKGSTFVVEPLFNAQSKSANDALTKAPDAIPLQFSKLKVLLVDDSQDNRKLLVQMLSKKGAYVVEAINGADGVAKALSSQFDIILMDIQMPVMDGFEAMRILRSKNYAGPIIALTAHAMPEERDLCFESGANEHLSKPVNKNDLFRLLQKFLRRF